MPYAGQRTRQKSAAQVKAEGRGISHGNTKLEENPAGKGAPVKPKGLSKDEARMWDDVVRSLPEGLLTSADSWMMEKFVTQMCFARKCSEVIERGGLMVMSGNGMYQKNPMIAARQTALNSAQAAAESLGLTPTARNRLSAPIQPAEGLDVDDLFSTDAPLTARPASPSTKARQ